MPGPPVINPQPIRPFNTAAAFWLRRCLLSFSWEQFPGLAVDISGFMNWESEVPVNLQDAKKA